MKKYNRIFPLLILLFFMSLSSCQGNKKAESEASEEETEILPEDIVEMRADQIKLAAIETGTIELRSLSNTLKVNGTVASAPENLAMVSMPLGGIVKSTSLMPGNSVRKGQTLALIENQEFIDIQLNYLEAKSKLEYTAADYKRQSDLYKNEASSQKNAQQATAEYKSLRVQVKALEQKLRLIGINPYKLHENNIKRAVALVSPISGYVKAVNVGIGKSVSQSDVLFEIVNLNKLFIELTLFEKDAAKVSKGQEINFFINNETEEHKAVVYQTAKSIDADKTYKVYASIEATCKNVLPGMYVNAVIATSTNKVTCLPSEAIVSFDGKDYIFVFERNKVENKKPFTEYRMVQIQKGVSDNGYTEVILPEKFNYKIEKIVLKGAYNLLSAKKNAGEMSC
ncbi:MAG: efflux RND transporter periplasmic adaptor subunit [Bacteroidaceae bacterium]|nr:efflux RND transporter periplasmic adaptor subunit [Bacteroidaceae bacterium]